VVAQANASLFTAGSGTQGTCAGVDHAAYFNGTTIPELNCVMFVVPKGVDKLDARIAWNPLQPCPDDVCTAGPPTVRASLIDPSGRYGQYSDPQGLGGGFGDEQIHQPAAGTWTLVLFGRATSPYEGAVNYRVTAQSFKTIRGAVFPASRLVAPGKSARFTLKVKSPSTAGFFTGAVVFNSNRQKAVGTIPVVSQAKITVSTKKAGHFTGWLTGGNARPSYFAQQLSYRFTVPKGVRDVSVNLKAAHDGYMLMAQLVDPSGHAVDSQLSFQYVTAGDDPPTNTNAVQLVWANPKPGTWKVNVQNGLFYLPGLAVYSGLTRSQLNGTVSFNTSKVSVFGLPSGTLSPGAHVTTHITVKNTGIEPELYQLDPRLTASQQYEALPLNEISSGTLPITSGASVPVYGVPPFSSQMQMTASTTGSTPIVFDFSPYWSAPDVVSAPSIGGTTSVTVNDPIASTWAPTIDMVGPFASPATPEDFSTSGTLTTLRFDPNATPSSGNVWSAIVDGTNDSLNPLFLLPGHSGTMAVTFTVPNGVAGTKINGVIPVETFDYNSFTTGIGDWSSDVVKIVHYSYTIG